mmetsp:Transcript_16977/g.37383  ORF Transcript_16977/g.37383 Transcript_16977/m.37383 type:complete len:163 (+) Transcript_16977:1-489(+)
MCPGLGKIVFTLPEWTGQWTEVDLDTINLSDDDVDNTMNLACQSQFSPTTNPANPNSFPMKIRAAETSEILLRSIKGMPTTNTAPVPLMGPCPNCAGDEDEVGGPQHVSGHARICWDQGQTLSGLTRRTDCSTGVKAVLCVKEVALPTALVNPPVTTTAAFR